MPMRRSNSNASLALASVLLAASAAVAAQVVAPAPPAPSPPVQTTDTLLDALTCRTSAGDIAGLLASKKYIPEGAGTLRTDTATFGVVVFGVIAIVAALSFFPALALGPIADHFSL